MGMSLDLFVEEVDPHLICPICREVFLKPVTLEDGCVFCRKCIQKWLQNEDSLHCPNDRNPISPLKRFDLGGDNRILVKLISKLRLICPFRLCKLVFYAEEYESHVSNCEHNPTVSNSYGAVGESNGIQSSVASECMKQFDGEFWKCGSQRLSELEYKLYKLRMEFERESLRVDRTVSKEDDDWDTSVQDSFIKGCPPAPPGVCNLSLDWEDVSEVPIMVKVCKKLTRRGVVKNPRLADIIKRVDVRLDYVYNIDDETLITGTFKNIERQAKYLDHLADCISPDFVVLLKTTDLTYLSKFFLMCTAYMVGRRGALYLSGQWAEYVTTTDESLTYQTPTNVEICYEDDEIPEAVKFDFILDCCGTMETHRGRLKDSGTLSVMVGNQVKLLRKSP